jgi:extradiol dioxygenase family protein
MKPTFHLSIGVKSIEESLNFIVGVLRGKVLHRDPSGYVNIDFFGSQITLKQNSEVVPNLREFHFGVNLSLKDFDELSTTILDSEPEFVTMTPEIWDAGTPMERKKMYLREPTGYVIEIKGYK